VSIYIQPNLFVRIEESTGERARQPLPLASGLSTDRSFEILGIQRLRIVPGLPLPQEQPRGTLEHLQPTPPRLRRLLDYRLNARDVRVGK
jgi:hypothetical protein